MRYTELMKADVVIIGAGVAGSAAARACALAGLTVRCLERRTLKQAGAHWINAVPQWCFDDAAVPLPRGAEHRKSGSHTVMVAGFDGPSVRFSAQGVLDVDMALLIERLRHDARQAGAIFEAPVAVHDVQPDSGGHRVSTSAGTLWAKTVVDASGIRGSNWVQAPSGPIHVCAAAQQQRRITCADSARHFMKQHNVQQGENLIFTGIAGGYSVVNVCVEGEEVGLLTGSLPRQGHPPGTTLLEQFVETQPWIGEPIRSGAGAIPLRPPVRPAWQGVAAFGDQGAQVFAAHGSSTGAVLVAASQLADVLASGGTAEDWGRQWMRSHGVGLATAYLFFRFSMTLSTDALGALMRSGLLSTKWLSAGLLQKRPAVALHDVPAVLRGAIQSHSVVRRLLPTAVKISRVSRLYDRYPGPNEQWEQRVLSLME